MTPANMAKYVVAIEPAGLVDDATATAVGIDTKGANYAEIVVQLGNTDIALTALKLQESDDDGSSDAYSDVAGATFDGGTAIDGTTLALPAATDDDQTCVFQVNLDGRERYLKVVATFDDGTEGGYIAAIARLSNLDYVPTDSTDMADGGVVRV